MANDKDRLIEDVQFVFAECARLQTEFLSGKRIEPNTQEAMERLVCTIPHPEVSWSFQVCGRAAYDRLDDLARRAAKNAEIDLTVSIANVRKELAAVIVRKFQTEKRGITVQNVERAMSEAAKRAGLKRQEISHFLACHLMLAKEPPSFQIGPVIFHSQKSFRSKIAKLLWVERGAFRKGRKHLRHAFDYYKAFGWVAEVSIYSCDKETSEDIAQETVRSALDCIHLLLGYRYTHRMVIEGPALQRDRRGRLSEVDGSLTYSVSYGGPGEVGFSNNWFSQFDDEGWAIAIRLCGIALESAANPRLDRPLSRRFLDAIKWFGEAVRETSRGAKVVKYVTAIERILMTDEMGDIAETVAQRAATMCCELPSRASFEAWKADTKKAYSLRSKLVHGSMSSNSPEAIEGVRLGAKVAEAALHSALAGFGETGLKAETVTTNELATWYNERVAYVGTILV